MATMLPRASNTMLREESAQNLLRAAELETKLKELEARTGPLTQSKLLLEAEKSALTADCKALEVENRRWKERNQQLLEKYGTIDTEEYARLQEAHAKLKAEEAALRALLEKEKGEFVRVS